MSPIIAYALLPLISTFLGGYVVLRWKRDLHPWLSLSGGILLGVAFLDLLPEAFEQGAENGVNAMVIGAGALGAILFFHILDKLLGAHHHEHASPTPDEHCANERHHTTHAWIRAAGLVLHSLMDGLAIGGGFAADPSLGLLITLAVVMHDFSDGMSTVTILKNALGPKHRGVLYTLLLDALAPFIGVLIGLKLGISAGMIAVMLAIFSGFFISISLSELLPQAHADKTHRAGLALTVLGIAFVLTFRLLAPV
ncbi:MAG: ZIP family metal transporter [Patescibacteria group bacterium]|jgi:ZIP family zinc transporter